MVAGRKKTSKRIEKEEEDRRGVGKAGVKREEEEWGMDKEEVEEGKR